MPALTATALYGAERSDLVAFGLLFLFLAAGAFLVFYALYRHLAANRYF